ncbi:MAG: putative PEP-CTERM system TPR-repeat lipoprotein [Halioglobus sp.]|jgi:putative PEP-CTERM system TPR-repeat lipoprotein
MSITFPARILCVVLFFSILSACGGDSAEEYIARAKQFIAESNYDAATIELKNALQVDSESGEARWLLGKFYLDSGDILSAEKELERSLALGWSRDEILPALAKVMMARSKFAEIDKLDGTELQPQAAASVAATKAMAAMALGKNRKAKKLIEHALSKAPESSDALFAEAKILGSQGDLAGAEAVLDSLLSLHPESGQGWELLADLRLGQHKLDEAEAAYSQAIEFMQSNYGVMFKRALLYLRMENYEAAQADTNKLLAIAPQHPQPNYVQGLLDFRAGNYAKAITVLSLAEPAAEQFPLVSFFLGSAQLIEGHIDQAAVQAVAFNIRVPESIRGRTLLATIRLQQGDFEAVQELLQPVLAANPDDIGALNLMANALLRDGKTDQGITLLSRVAELQPDSPVAQVRLGAGLLLEGSNDDAAQHIESALVLAPEFQQADILLVMNYLQKKDYQAAIEAAQAYRGRHLASVTPYNLLGRVYLEAGRQDEAVASFKKALAIDAADPAANHNLAQLAILDGDLGIARTYYETILDSREDFLPALIQIAMLDARENNGEALVAHLEQAITAHPDNLQPRLLMARYHLSQERPDKVALVFASMDPVQKKSSQVLQLMAMAQLSGNENEEAQYTLEQLAESVPDTAPLRQMMANAAAGSGDIKRAERELRKALELDENYLPARLALARMALSKGQLDEYQVHIEKLRALAPDNADVLLLQASAAARKGEHDAAVALAQKAYSQLPVRATLLALALHKSAAGDSASALQLYQQWVDDNPGDVPVRLVMAETLAGANKMADAISYYEQVIKIDPDNVTALNNLAWHIRDENPAKALKAIRHASTLAPDSPDVLDTLAMVEYGNKDYVSAQRSIDRALDKKPDNATLIYHKAMILIAADKSAAAEKILHSLIESGTDFPEVNEAEALLAKLKN